MKNTLFVLGAGASYPYGMPLGFELGEEIRALGESRGHLWDTLNQFGLAGQMAGLGSEFQQSRMHSIDAFLSCRPDLAQAGKLAISAAIRRRETTRTVPSATGTEDWFGYLWTRLAAGTKTAAELPSSKVRFVTFNYDRTLEGMLYQAICSTFGVTKVEGFRVLADFQIRHVYGVATPFNPAVNDSTGCPYGLPLTRDNVLDAAEQIRVMPEHREGNDVEFMTARKWFDWAEHVWFLGFGFDPTNVARLGFESVLADQRQKNRAPPRIAATVSGLGQAELDEAKRSMLQNSPQVEIQHASPFHYQNSLSALKHFGI